MDSEFKYFLTHKANNDIGEIIEYITSELCNPKAAADFMYKLQEIIGQIRLFPKIGAPVDNEFLPASNVRKILIGNYIMYYTPDFSNETIYVLRVVYGKRNIDEILKNIL